MSAVTEVDVDAMKDTSDTWLSAALDPGLVLTDGEGADLKAAALYRAVETGGCLRTALHRGVPRKPKELMDALRKQGARPIMVNGPVLEADRPSSWLLDDGLLRIETVGSDPLVHAVMLYALSDERIQSFTAWFEKQYEPEPMYEIQRCDGSVHMLVSTPIGLRVQRIGQLRAPLERGNYTATVLTEFDRAIVDLNSDTPSGRIVIMDGPPGTGKTYLIRAMTMMADCAFVFVPTQLAQQLGDPSLIPALLGAREAHDRLALVFEDADQLLSPRQGLTMAALATVLNLGDGVLGELLNVRVVCTTNSPVREMDPALLRPGRLSARVAVSTLAPSDWHPIYTRLTGRAAKGRGRKTLAEVYAMARAT